MSLSDLLQNIETQEVEDNSDLEQGTGTSWIKEAGVFKVKIDKVFITETKKGGLKVSIHTKENNSYREDIYPVIIRKGKKTTTFNSKGKTATLPSYKLFKQLMFVTGSPVVELNKIETKIETITYKAFGKDVTEEVAILPSLTDKEIYIGIKKSAEYNYEDGEVDKTCYKTDNDGEIRWNYNINSVYDSQGKTAMEIIKKEESAQMAKDKAYLESAKSIYKPKLELPEEDEIEAGEESEADNIEF